MSIPTWKKLFGIGLNLGLIATLSSLASLSPTLAQQFPPNTEFTLTRLNITLNLSLTKPIATIFANGTVFDQLTQLPVGGAHVRIMYFDPVSKLLYTNLTFTDSTGYYQIQLRIIPAKAHRGLYCVRIAASYQQLRGYAWGCTPVEQPFK